MVSPRRFSFSMRLVPPDFTNRAGEPSLKPPTKLGTPSNSMRISLSYPGVTPFEIPDSNVLACLQPRAIEPSRPVAELVEEALEHPIGSPPLEEIASARA